jgi:hypothetical protein
LEKNGLSAVGPVLSSVAAVEVVEVVAVVVVFPPLVNKSDE